MEYRIALAQVAPRLGEVDDNLELARDWLRRGAAEGAQLVAFPELALTGYLLADLVPEVAMALRRPAPGGAQPRASRRRCWRSASSRRPMAHRFCNSAALLRDGELIGLHRKVYLPTYGMFDEGRFTRAGDRIRTHRGGGAARAASASRVCEDFWHASLPMVQALDGAGLLVNLAAGPARAPGSSAGLAAIAGWHKMQDTYALLGTVPIAFCNRVGNEEGLTFWGGSRLLGADGSTIAEGPLYEEALVVGAIDTDDLRMQRYGLPLLADERLELVRRELDRIIAERAGLPEADGGATRERAPPARSRRPPRSR